MRGKTDASPRLTELEIILIIKKKRSHEFANVKKKKKATAEC